MKFRFKPEDFCDDKNPQECDHGFMDQWCSGTYYANKANKILEAHEQTLQRVYGFRDDRKSGLRDIQWDGDKFMHTHTALLYGIEKIISSDEEKDVKK